MAIRVLLDHGVPQDHIIFVTFLAARSGGISMLQRAFPDVKVVCGAVDDHLQEMWLECEEGEGEQPTEGRKVWVVEPGMGHIGRFRRYLELLDVAYWGAQVIGTISRMTLKVTIEPPLSHAAWFGGGFAHMALGTVICIVPCMQNESNAISRNTGMSRGCVSVRKSGMYSKLYSEMRGMHSRRCTCVREQGLRSK